MNKSLAFLLFVAFSSLQFLASAQNDDFLSPTAVEVPAVPDTNASFAVVQNTAGEIGIAVSNALNLIFRVVVGSSVDIANNVAADLSRSLQQYSTVQATALATQIGAVVNERIRSLNDSTINVSNSVGNLVRDSVEAFRNARDRGEDVGAAVGLVVGNAVRTLNDTADDIGHIVEEGISDGVDHFGNLSSQVLDVADQIGDKLGEAVENVLEAVSASGEWIQDIVANAINNGINQSEARNTSQEIGNSVNSLEVIIRDSSGSIADAIANLVSNTVAKEVKGVDQRDVIMMIRETIRAEVDRTIRNTNLYGSQISEGVNFAINYDLQARGDNTVSVSEVINIFGQIIAIGVANSLSHQQWL